MCVRCFDLQYLEHPDEEHGEADGGPDAGVVLHQGLAAAPGPQVEPLAQTVVVEVSRGVADLLLDAGPRREGAAAAEGNLVHQVPAAHVAPEPAVRTENRS